MTHTLTLTIGVLSVSLAAGPALGQQAASESTVVSATVTVAPMAKLNLSTTSLTFPDTNPDLAPLVAAAEGPVLVTARARATPGNPITLTVQVLDNLRAGTAVIPASAVSWTASGDGFVNGALSAAAAQTVAIWRQSGQHAGMQTYRFQNAWTYATGTYTLTIIYTLTAP